MIYLLKNFEVEYKYLKSAIEGGASAKPEKCTYLCYI